MSKQRLLRELEGMSSDSLEARVYRCYLGHPSVVGPPGFSRRLDLSRPDDCELFLRAVNEEWERLKSSLSFLEKPQALTYFQAAQYSYFDVE